MYTFIDHNDVIKWKPFPRYWPFVREIHRLPVNSPHKGQWRGALMFSLICTWTNAWVNNRDFGDLRRHLTHYGVAIMLSHCKLRTHGKYGLINHKIHWRQWHNHEKAKHIKTYAHIMGLKLHWLWGKTYEAFTYAKLCWSRQHMKDLWDHISQQKCVCVAARDAISQ